MTEQQIRIFTSNDGQIQSSRRYPQLRYKHSYYNPNWCTRIGIDTAQANTCLKQALRGVPLANLAQVCLVWVN